MPRLAIESVQAGGFSGVAKLRDVRVEQGWVCGRAGNLWEPLEAYFQDQKPYLEFARCEKSQRSLIHFCEKLGAVIVDPQRSTGHTIKFREAEFWREQWRFAFLVGLASSLGNAEILRKKFGNALDVAGQQCLPQIDREPITDDQGLRQSMSARDWQHLILDIARVILAPKPTEKTNTAFQYTKAMLRCTRPHLANMADKDLRTAATNYLLSAINDRLGQLRPILETDLEDRFRLYSHCENLLQRFYWMLALDLDKRRLPKVCAYCGRFFPSSKGNVTYCPDRSECKERGRRRLDRQRHGDAYNRTRREKRQLRRQKKQGGATRPHQRRLRSQKTSSRKIT